jgi:hypothetical protein
MYIQLRTIKNNICLFLELLFFIRNTIHLQCIFIQSDHIETQLVTI